MPPKLLIANRGAVAVRVARTCARMGVATVAVFAGDDAESTHVTACDEAVELGGASKAETYLSIPAILAAARKTNATMIHPGYGFLSENAAFAEACAAAGITFVGPTPANMADFGLKHRARELAKSVGVPILEGTPLLPTIDDAVAAAATIGYPVPVSYTHLTLPTIA